MFSSIIEVLDFVLDNVAELAISVFELIGVAIIIISGLRGCYSYIRRDPHTTLTLAQGFALGLEFKLGGEILRTVIVRQWSEILTVAGIIALRAALTFLIHWEIHEEERDEERKIAASVPQSEAEA